MNTGWVKLYRKLLENSIITEPHLLQVFIYCLLRANHATRKILMGGKELILQPGQFVTGRNEASSVLKLKGKMWDRKTILLEKLGILTRKVTNQFTIITIVNWNSYQGTNNNDDQVYDQRKTSEGPTDDQQMTTNNNGKNDENYKKKEVDTTSGLNGENAVSMAQREYTSTNVKPNGCSELSDMGEESISLPPAGITEKCDDVNTTLLSNSKIYFDYEACKFVNITESLIFKWREAYPAIDVCSELKQMESWAFANPNNRKSNWQRFIVNWLKRSHDKLGTLTANEKKGNNYGSKSKTVSKYVGINKKNFTEGL